MIRIGVLGSEGRMGRLVVDEVLLDKRCVLTGIASRRAISDRKDMLDTTSYSPVAEHVIASDDVDVLINFTAASVTSKFAHLASEVCKPFMTGTTGLTDEDMESLKQSARRIPILHAPNTSRSFAQFSRRVEEVTRELSDSIRAVEIIDEHHSGKNDEPSGSALLLRDAIRKVGGDRLQFNFKSIREGDTVGKHTVIFTGDGEAQFHGHEITDRRVFARGAVGAAIWLHKKGPGLYGMNDVLRP